MGTGYYNSDASVSCVCARKQSDIVALIRELVECESPSDQPPAVNRFVDLLAEPSCDGAQREDIAGRPFRNHLRCEFNLPGAKATARFWRWGIPTPCGRSARCRPCRSGEAEGRLWGPGVLDMKSGIVFFLFAMRALRELDIPVRAQIVLQVNSDEEVGSESSRRLPKRQRSSARLCWCSSRARV